MCIVFINHYSNFSERNAHMQSRIHSLLLHISAATLGIQTVLPREY